MSSCKKNTEILEEVHQQIPNTLSLARAVTAPLFVLAFRSFSPDNSLIEWSTLLLLNVMFVTDWLDGFYARRFSIVSNLGKALDPAADSIMFMVILFAFYDAPRFNIPIWPSIIVIYREVTMHLLRRFAALRGVVLAAKFSGKLKTFSQCIFVSLFIFVVALSDEKRINFFKLSEETIDCFAVSVSWLIAAANILSLPEYFIFYFKSIHSEKQEKKE